MVGAVWLTEQKAAEGNSDTSTAFSEAKASGAVAIAASCGSYRRRLRTTGPGHRHATPTSRVAARSW